MPDGSGDDCVPFVRLDQGLDRDQGLTPLTARCPANPSTAVESGSVGFSWLHRHPRVRLPRHLAPAAWMLVLYIGSLASLFLTSLTVSTRTAATSRGHQRANYRTLLDRSVYLDIAVRTVKIAALVTISTSCSRSDRLLHGEGRRRAGGDSARRRGAGPSGASYLVKAFSWRAIIGSPGGVLDKTFGMSPNYGETALSSCSRICGCRS